MNSENTNIVLVAEDDREIAIFLGTLLLKQNLEVKIVGDGQAAIDFMAHTRPSLLCLDLNLPVVSGFEVFRYVRNSPRLASVPVIVASARSGLNVEAEVQELGADVFLSKPIRSRVFIKTVKDILGLKRK